ncbi:V-type ATP synthase subunit E [Methanogenium organophilum]|uniref:V-type ATP synthase subunit E n=1 Tax=Methanogenium organophilum TaxID=2199 RepID=A0A9X9T8Q0_METOG|nr:V-type ATP synthase subunit E [Methanogenium organophilum]WAI01661.1 V-type ATP synthase subunit E [Methanogenium organophilum]
MGVEEIIARMNADAAEEATRIIRAADNEVSLILSEGEIAADAVYTTISDDGRREAAARRRKILARAQLAARGGVREAREDGIDRCFSGAKEQLSHLPGMPIYPEVLQRLIAEGLEIVGPGECQVLFREGDRDAVESALAEFPGIGMAFLQEMSRDRRGGGLVVACGSRLCDQRFSARCERMRERLTRETACILYGGND